MSIYKTSRIEQVLLSLLRSFHNTYLHNQASQDFWIFDGICLLFCKPFQVYLAALAVQLMVFGLEDLHNIAGCLFSLRGWIWAYRELILGIK